MFTTNRTVLISKNPRILTSAKKFEGIEQILSRDEIETVWSYNKTPILFANDGGLPIPEFESSVFIKNFPLWAEVNGIDVGEFCDGTVFDTAQEPCVLCAIAAHKGLTKNTIVYNKTVDKEYDIVIYESRNFFVVPELGGLKRGFLMICPKRHVLSVAQFSKEEFVEYEEVCFDIEQILVETFGLECVSFFEHGSRPDGFSSHKRSIVHAHTHVLHDFVLQDKYLQMVRAEPLDDISIIKNSKYFAYRLGTTGKLFCSYDSRVYIPRQFVRRVIAEQCGYAPNQFNWRFHKFEENIKLTLHFLHKYITSRFTNARIVERTKAFAIGYAQRQHSVLMEN